jgi:hypothetical protein
MRKRSRRETMVILLGGLACLGGCSTQTGLKKPALPENCYWVEFKYAWFCLDLEVKPGDSTPSRESNSQGTIEPSPDLPAGFY